MKLLHGGLLWQYVQSSSANAKIRVWIASPYIGDWNAVRTLLGTSWWHDPAVDFRILTDFEEAGNYATLEKLRARGIIRNLVGLHAKLYIFDSNALVTSANLTRAGFNKLYEAGLTAEDGEEVVSYFEMLWKQSRPLTEVQIDRLRSAPEHGKFNDQRANLPERWGMPKAPPESAFEARKSDSEYHRFVINFRELTALYEAVEGQMWTDMPLSLEVDAFLNFLLHEHPSKPSANYYGPGSDTPRPLNSEERQIEIAKYAKEFHQHEALDNTNHVWRKKLYERFQYLLSREHLPQLTDEEIKEIVGGLHTMNAFHFTMPKFLRSGRNTPEGIRSNWRNLLYGADPIEERIKSCVALVYGMGENSVQELLGWRFPKEYPIRNSNTDAGMLFFGYLL